MSICKTVVNLKSLNFHYRHTCNKCASFSTNLDDHSMNSEDAGPNTILFTRNPATSRRASTRPRGARERALIALATSPLRACYTLHSPSDSGGGVRQLGAV